MTPKDRLEWTMEVLEIEGTAFETHLTRKFRNRRSFQPKDPRRVVAHIPGVIQAIHVAPGQRVQRGDRLVVLEAMKMQNDLTAREDGVVAAVHVALNQMVTKGQLILELE
jgi:biotin carboxyl carrier protein